MMDTAYLFTSERLGFRTWTDADLPAMAAINSDPEVMEFFPTLRSMAETATALQQFRTMYEERGYCFYAVETLVDKQFIGFTGLSRISYEASFTPCVEIGWRLARTAWGKGYATEGARRCLEHAFDTLQLDRVRAIAPVVNQRSIHVMKKCGMQPLLVFDHPLLTDAPHLQPCVCYEALPGRKS